MTPKNSGEDPVIQPFFGNKKFPTAQNIFAVLHVFLSTVVFVAFRVERVCPFPNFFVWLSTFSLRPSFQLSNDERPLVNPAFLLNLGALPVPPFDLEQGDADCCCEKDSKADCD